MKLPLLIRFMTVFSTFACVAATAQVAPECSTIADALARMNCVHNVELRAIPTGKELEEFTAIAKQNLVHDFKDPGSVQYRSLFLSMREATPVLCGEVNGKNGYGAYVGFRQFYATRDAPIQQIREPNESYSFTVMYSKMCANKVVEIQ
jgi:hypothetical protein